MTDGYETPVDAGPALLEPSAPAPTPGRRRRRPVLWTSLGAAALVAVLIAVLATSGPASQVTSSSPLIGRLAPPVSGPPVGGSGGPRITLSSLSGRWVLVNFAASWCTPCQQEMPQLLTFAQRHAATGNATVLTVQDDPADGTNLHTFLASRHATWPAVDDPAASVAYGVGALPESYLVDPSGTVVAKVTGGAVADSLDSLITQLGG